MKRTVFTLVAGVVLGAGLLYALLMVYLPDELFDSYAPAPVAAEPDAELVYTCGMHPDVVRHEAGRCPICGMKLVVKKRTEERDAGVRDGAVRVPPDFLQNFAVRTATARRGSLPITVRTVGVLAHDEERLVSVNTKFEGWIEHAYVNNVGEAVQQGDALFDIYSPQLATTQREYLAALDYAARLEAQQAYPDALARARALVAAARERLGRWDIAAAQIDALERAGEVPRTVRFHSPVAGLVVGKMGDSLPGMRLEPGMTVLKIADHSTLWAQVALFEGDLAHVAEGSEASIEAAAFPERRWSGRILFFRSALDPDTRSLTAFVEVDNADLMLRPMMHVDVSLRGEGATDAVLVPAEAVLHSGKRAVVIVAKERALFEPREVSLGIAADGMQVIADGIAAGEEVVVSSQFLIDSESNLKAAAAQLLRGQDQGAESAPPGHHHH